MKISLTVAAIAALLIPAAPALAGTAAPAAVGPALVARYTFDGGALTDSSGRSPALTVRAADRGAVKFTGGYAAFPAVCAAGAAVCPRALLEAANDADLNPGTRFFRWSARVNVTKAQIAGSSNVMQKGVNNTGSQWKMQIGATNGKAQCVVVGAGSSVTYLVRSAGTVADGVWHKVLCQRSGTTLSVWVDNVQRGSATIPSTLSMSNALPLRLGGPNFNARSDMYHGLLDDVYAELG